MRPPTARRRALVIALAAGAALVASIRPAAAQLMSPGPLAQPHAHLEGDSHCDDCHQSGKQVVARRCLACHSDLNRKVAAGTGLHGRAYRGKACEQCHVEHISRKNPLVRWPGGRPEKLDHDLTGWPLEGDHAKVACRTCHKQKTAGGRPTFIAARPACRNCHRDPHGGRFGADCRKCHDLEEWHRFDQRGFNHAMTRYPLTGKHLPVACDQCHGTPPRWKGIGFATCDACHDDPHDGEFRRKACTACHDTRDWAGAEAKMRGNHRWLSLRNGHARLGCKRCHDRGNSRPPSKGNACADCHRPIHEASFGNRCETCHRSIKWVGLPERVGRDAHDKTAFALVGRHAAVACDGCHPKSMPQARRYRQLAFDRCAACHADRHAGEFAARAGGECGACHTVAGFAPTSFGLAAHATTSFPLDGKHAATPCRGCHGATRPRLDFRQARRACAECHADPHAGQFAREMADGGCAHCHSTADWHQPRIDHSTWPLTGAHARAACARCHGRTTAPGAGKADAATYRGVPRACDGCHDDVHAGQFRTSEPVETCDACHTTEAFAIARFDHAGRAGYPLEGEHARVACRACHPTAELRNGASAVRYRLGYRACRDCHANPHREGSE